MAKGKKYTPDIVSKILDYYVIYGNKCEVARKLNLIQPELNMTECKVRRYVKLNETRVNELKKKREPILERMFTQVIEETTVRELELIAQCKNISQISVVKAINYDKRALIRGQPTQITKDISQERQDELDKFIRKTLEGQPQHVVANKGNKGDNTQDNTPICGSHAKSLEDKGL